MFTNAVGMMSDSAFGVQKNLSSISSLASSASSSASESEMSTMLKKEQALTSENLKNQFVYNASDMMADSQDKINKENIKRTFSLLA